MNVIEAIYGYVGQIGEFLKVFWESFIVAFQEVYCFLFRQALELSYSIFSAIPVPEVLSTFTWPTISSGWGVALVHCGIPQAVAILAAAFTIKLAVAQIKMALMAAQL